MERLVALGENDPALKRTCSGAERGKGAVYAWDGNKNVGAGRMEILETIPPSKIVIKLDFFRPFEAHNTAEFTMLPQGGATNVHWVMRGPVAVHLEGDAGLHQLRQDDRQGFRDRPRQHEDAHRESEARTVSAGNRKKNQGVKRCRSIPIFLQRQLRSGAEILSEGARREDRSEGTLGAGRRKCRCRPTTRTS